VWSETRLTRQPDRPETSPTLGELLKQKAEEGVNVSTSGGGAEVVKLEGEGKLGGGASHVFTCRDAGATAA
jgi:hypothetical protein